MLPLLTLLLTVLVGTTAAYAFSRFKFPGREAGMLGFIIVVPVIGHATWHAYRALVEPIPAST